MWPAASLLSSSNVIEKVRHFTARVSGQRDPQAPARQQIYLDALRQFPEYEVHFGSFSAKTIRRPLVRPPPNGPRTAEVHTFEEKGSDVNPGVHLLHDAWKQRWDMAVVITNDTDLREPIHLVVSDLGKKVIVMPPATNCASQLRRVASHVRHFHPEHLQAACNPHGSIPSSHSTEISSARPFAPGAVTGCVIWGPAPAPVEDWRDVRGAARTGCMADATDTLPGLFFERVEATPDRPAFQHRGPDGRWVKTTWAEAKVVVDEVAAGLLSLGVNLEDRAAILSNTRIEWIWADLGILCSGAATTTIYPSNVPEEIAFIVSDSESRFLFAEDASQLEKLFEARAQMPSLEKVIVFDGRADGDWVVTLDELRSMGRAHLMSHPTAVSDVCARLTPEHLSTLIYTSGTTGRPKGVELTHRNWTFEGKAVRSTGILSIEDHQFLWLPLAHSFGKVLEAAQLAVGFMTSVDGEIPRLVDNLAETRPTFMAAAPRIFEKVYNKVVTGARAGSKVKYEIFKWAMSVGREVSRLRQEGKEPRGLLAVRHRVADRLVFSKLKQRFGGRIRFFVSGGAPLSRQMAEFFHAADLLILEGYGLTESSAASFVNVPDNYAFGTVGPPAPGVEVAIADDGEVMLRGPGIMRGYRNRPEDTAETLVDGWLMTGDIGELDAKGRLRITDRKKDLIKTSGGKYVAPQALEARLKAACPYISQVVVHGNNRNFCTALITLDPESITSWQAEHGLESLAYADLTDRPEVRAMIREAVDELNRHLASYETIKDFAVLPTDFSIETGELTASMKVKRKVVEEKYRHVLDGFYRGSLEAVS
jgi:long-chain acyl-CoA synthetase